MSYTAPALPRYQLFVTVDGASIVGSPFTVTTLNNLEVDSALEYAIAAIASVVAFLLSNGARYVTGQHILVDGGVSFSLKDHLPRKAPERRDGR